MPKGDYFPNDIIFEILIKVPSKSVLRFKIACKTWCSLISDPVFINLHSKLAPRSPKILYSGSGSSFQLLDYNSSSFDDCCLSSPINFPYYRFPKILGSSYGLVCLQTDFLAYSFCIWNPLTRESRKLPNFTVEKKRSNYFHGLGYDSVANDFKLVVSTDRIIYNIFSLKENSWKKIACPIAFEYYHPDAVSDKLHDVLFWHSIAIVLNGIFYWLVAPLNNDHEIVAFDVSKETFQKLPFPDKNPVNLLEHRGCLCISFSDEIWMMKEYGVWIHLLTVKDPQRFGCFALPVLCIPTRTEVTSHTDEKISRCVGEEEDKLNEICMLRHAHTAVLYVETLISPNTDDRLQVTANKVKEKKKLINFFAKFRRFLVSRLCGHPTRTRHHT